MKARLIKVGQSHVVAPAAAFLPPAGDALLCSSSCPVRPACPLFRLKMKMTA